MEYYEYALTYPLSEYIQTVWAMQSEGEDDAYPRSQIMPDGIVEVIFHYEKPFYTYQDGEKFLQPESFAISMMRKFIEIESNGRTGFISIRFFPWGAHHFFDKPVKDFLDQTIESSLLWGKRSAEILHVLRACMSIQERFKAIEVFLLDRYAEFKKVDTSTDELIKLIRREKGTLSVEKICEENNMSKSSC